MIDWKVFMLAYGILFLAELGDKTQLAVFTMVTQYKSPVSVFLGASLALATVTLIGVLFGEAVSRYVPPQYLQIGAGILFVGIGIFVLYQAIGGLMH